MSREWRRWTAAVLWEPRDLWIGVFWERSGTVFRIYVCLIPCVPIKLTRWAADA